MSPPYDTNTTSDVLVKDYADLIKGKVVLTTGISPGGLGAAFVHSIASAQPSLLILANRDMEKAQRTKSNLSASHPSVETRLLKVDLSLLQSVRDAAAELNNWSDVPVVDVLVNSAGIMGVEYGLTADGFEKHLASNHLGPFLFTNLIIDKILASKSPRIVNVTSNGHRFGPFRFGDYNFDEGKTYHNWRAYGQSKTANMLFSISLAEKLGNRGLLSFSVHPGGIMTNLGTHLDFSSEMQRLTEIDRQLGNIEGIKPELNWQSVKSIERGVATYIYAAFDPDLTGNNGAYTLDCHVGDPFTETILPWATSSVEAEKLWRLSEQLVEVLVKDYADIIAGKVVLTTGVSPGGLGASFVQSIAAANPSLLILANRDLVKAENTASAIAKSHPNVKARILHLDLASFQSVRKAADQVNSWSDIPAIDVLVNNAAVLGGEYGHTADGFEHHLATNHLGPFLFTNLIINKILASRSARIVNVSSNGHRLSPFRFGDYNFDGGKTYDSWRAYGQSKTANALFSISLAEKLGKRGLLSFSVHPGGIFTNMAARLDFATEIQKFAVIDRSLGNRHGVNPDLNWENLKTMERGTATYIFAAFAPDIAAHNGSYTLDCHVVDAMTEDIFPWATSSVEAEKLWRLSEELVGQKFQY
ncbi:hypothetical protein CVT26_013479 [Gymnopilus dilepis]|uniref:Uncharacterized protein n=1 Tax=Gymnopilus dilepis TaxID=231916 RepID=A0A409YWT5_9AGAR|nr:hypothetical protein CVT26_013479 [Gymnopilus dilepis]